MPRRRATVHRPPSESDKFKYGPLRRTPAFDVQYNGGKFPIYRNHVIGKGHRIYRPENGLCK